MRAGNKLFQSTFIRILAPNASILLTLEWTLLNSAVSLVRPGLREGCRNPSL